MCGVTGLLLGDPSSEAVTDIYESLGVLQHRGQDAAGIITCGYKGRLYQCKGSGMVRDVFDNNKLSTLRGSMGIGHTRYPTAGSSSSSEAQPFYVNSPYGICMAHNGNLTNAIELREFLDHEAHRHINTESDSELLLNIFAANLQKSGKVRINEEDIYSALAEMYTQVKGAYACTVMLAGFGIMGFRDPNGIRPLVLGRRETPAGPDWMLASESVALDVLGFSTVGDVQPGEVVIITRDGGISRRQCGPRGQVTPCIFEFVYFARPDSIMDGISVYKSRLAMGEALADETLRVLGKENDIDVVIPVPDTSRVAALQLSYRLGIIYREGFIKNRYVGRTFIMPGQTMRRQNVKRKLNPMALEFAGKNVLIVDDSIVRGTTSKEIIQMARDSGAKKVYVASCAPPIRWPNVYGIDMPSRHELVAWGRSEDDIAEEIGADRVIFQRLEDLVAACAKINPAIEAFDVSVFNGSYVTGDISDRYLAQLEACRNDNAKLKSGKANGGSSELIIGLHNNWRSKP
ncbi:amidophosphoribosyltransferase [Gonapodya prolifera JEL478]|uniref:Amidophosphoribosyltransferase n=1 Tax=Gonapodya prolifera (strain JEL478) TaxID=1344416 RepID=A0A139AVY3_GONPJ|nr:amidophosphoribosyltransferase [Gonapodya prolifera JEL478]|eukprot:KXS20892.1 amidophosphoribosyltransferase [Gonapodya prolifera JEL478]